MLRSKTLQLVTTGRLVLPRILAVSRIPLSTSAPVHSSAGDSSSNRADVNSNSPPRVSQQRATPESYQRARRGAFFQPMPQLHNPFIEDPFLRTCLSNMLPPQVSIACTIDFVTPRTTWSGTLISPVRHHYRFC